MPRMMVVVVVGLVTLGAPRGGYAQPSSGATVSPLTAQDYEEIRALYARYNQGSDFRDAELFLSAFAEDAVITRGGRDIIGTAALRADRNQRYAGQTGDNGRRHHNGSILITPAPEGATARAYFVLLDVTTRPPTILGSGYYDDTFTRTPRGWRIRHRTIHSDGTAR